MGKTSKPLSIIAIGECALWGEELDALEKQGHLITRVTKAMDDDPTLSFKAVSFETLLTADIIVGPKAWRMDDLTRKYLGVALKEARMLRYSGPGPRASKKNRADAVAEIGPLPEAEHFPGGKYDPDRKGTPRLDYHIST